MIHDNNRYKFMEMVPLMKSEQKINSDGEFSDVKTEEMFRAWEAGRKSLAIEFDEPLTEIAIANSPGEEREKVLTCMKLARDILQAWEKEGLI